MTTRTQQPAESASFAENQPELLQLVEAPVEVQTSRGYYHSLREILQQPSTWLATAQTMPEAAARVSRCVSGIKSLVLTGSGSSEYAGGCVRLPLQNSLGIVCESIGSGTLLTLADQALPPERPSLLVSLSRSGDSPESLATVSMLLQREPELRHLVLTCNAEGALARTYLNDRQATVVTLDPRTNDRSLVMTSSFTNLVLAARFLGYLDQPAAYKTLCHALSQIAERMLSSSFGTLAGFGRKNFDRVVYLGSGSQLDAARESALKMMEMTAGRICVLYETYLGLRHGPMSFVSENTLVVGFLSSDARRRAYELDLLGELTRKKLGLAKLVIGDHVPREGFSGEDAIIECDGLAEAGDENAPVIDVLAGQLLAFFRCLHEGLKPDSPSDSGVISRVVESFTLHNPPWDQDGP